MSTLTEAYALSIKGEFRGKVAIATVKAASAILADPMQPHHSVMYGRRIMNEPFGDWLKSMAAAVVSNPAINEQSTDSDIEFTVNSQFEKLAAAMFGDTVPQNP